MQGLLPILTPSDENRKTNIPNCFWPRCWACNPVHHLGVIFSQRKYVRYGIYMRQGIFEVSERQWGVWVVNLLNVNYNGVSTRLKEKLREKLIEHWGIKISVLRYIEIVRLPVQTALGTRLDLRTLPHYEAPFWVTSRLPTRLLLGSLRVTLGLEIQ